MSGEAKVVAIAGWEVLSAFGIGKAHFKEALRNGRKVRCNRRPDVDCESPMQTAHQVPDFDVKTALPGKGTRSFDRQTGLFLAATASAVSDSGLELGSETTGIIQCTSTGSVKSVMDFCRDTFVQSRPYLVDPSRFPNTVLNCAAGQCAIRHGFKGPNLTLAGGHASFYSGLRYTQRWLMNDFAAAVLTGAVEEVSEQSAWAYVHTSSAAHRLATPLSEACAVFVCRPESETGEPSDLPRVLAAEVRCFFGEPSLGPEWKRSDKSLAIQTEGLALVIRRCLAAAGISADEVALVCRRGAGSGRLAAAERAGVDRALGPNDGRELIVLEDWIGETYSAMGAMQLAAILARFEMADHPYALATAVSEYGSVACMVVERGRGG